MNTRHARPEHRSHLSRRPAHVPRPRPRAGAWRAFCRARRNAIIAAMRKHQAARRRHRQLSLGLAAAHVIVPEPPRPVAPLRPHRQTYRPGRRREEEIA